MISYYLHYKAATVSYQDRGQSFIKASLKKLNLAATNEVVETCEMLRIIFDWWLIGLSNFLNYYESQAIICHQHTHWYSLVKTYNTDVFETDSFHQLPFLRSSTMPCYCPYLIRLRLELCMAFFTKSEHLVAYAQISVLFASMIDVRPTSSRTTESYLYICLPLIGRTTLFVAVYLIVYNHY